MTSIDASAIALSWVTSFGQAVEAGDVERLVSTFVPDGYLRDILVFTWNNRTLHGHGDISSFLSSTLAHASIANVRLDERQYFSPVYGQIGPGVFAVSTGFTFETPIANGTGYARLVEDEQKQWKALSVFTMIDEFKGYPEIGQESGSYGGHTLAWDLVKDERRRKIESEPHVVIVGVGQTSLNIGARLKQMSIPTLIIDKNPRVGDVWRNRYPTLVLHTPRPHHSMNYQPFPSNWPTFSPRNKIADWLEQYAISQDLVVWTNSTLQPVPTYDPSTGRWTCIVSRNGTPVLLNPAHIVMACGTLGAPRIPSVPKATEFGGIQLHAAQYQGGMPYTGKRVIVVGAGNTSADICQDLVFHGAKSVIMVQRSSTSVVSQEKTAKMLLRNWPQDVPVEVSDFKFWSQPWGMLRSFAIEANKIPVHDKETEMLERLEAKGLKLNSGTDGSGQFLLVFERFGGYWLDVGVADLIHEGKVIIKQGVEISSLTPSSVIFTDKSEHDVDVIIYATGYNSILESLKPVFGEDVIEKTPSIWGFDEEQEINGCYRPSGQPGLWYGAGDFCNSRFFSKQLGLEIKAIQLGYMAQ